MKYQWGKYTWILFHIIVEKIDPLSFNKISFKIINWIKKICLNLPCPYCSEHATTLLNKYKNYNKILNKEDLKRFIYEFHNIVNKKVGKKIQDIDVLEKYKNGNLNKYIKNMELSFYIKYK